MSMSVYHSKPWLKSYKLGPFELASSMTPNPIKPLFSFLDESVAKFGQRPACLYGGRVIPYKELGELVNRLAAGLCSLG